MSRQESIERGGAVLTFFFVGFYGGGDDGFDRHAMFLGGGGAIGEFRFGVYDPAFEEADLDFYFTEGGFDGYKLPDEFGSLEDAASDAERKALLEKGLLHGLNVGDFANYRELHGRAVVLHADGCGENVQGSLLEEFIVDVGDEFAGGIVDIGFEQADGIGGLSIGGSGLAEDEADDVGEVFRFTGACAVADFVDFHGRQGGKFIYDGYENSSGGWCEQFKWGWAGGDGDAF